MIMKLKRTISNILMALMVAGQFGWAGLASADTVDPSLSPSPAAEVSPSPSDMPSVAPSVNPQPSDSPSPVGPASPSPSASVQPSSLPSPSVSPAVVSPSPTASSVVGPGGCGGVIPSWVFDTSSKTWVAADAGSFSCDAASGYFLSPKYFYDKRVGWYEIIPASTPKPDYMITAPDVIHTVLGDLVVGSKDYDMAKALGLVGGADSIAISGTGPSSNNQAGIANSGQTWIDLTNLVNVINTLQSNANSGNVAADSNTQVGSAVTGAANVIANIFNLLASAWSWSNGGLNFFMQNLFGNKTGDITLTPTEAVSGGGGQLGGTSASAGLAGTGPGSINQAGINNSATLDVNAKNTGNIVNNVNLAAGSGNASATNNTSAGNVASGNASAEANIINMINSFITSGSSFFGILNIFGNLNGDILFPSGFLNGLVPTGSASAGGNAATISGTGPSSTNQAGINNSGQANINNAVNNGVANNITTTASSGAATADSNSQVGNLRTGNANTTQGLFNLSNSSIFGDNAVLVIVNVLGHWVGKIMSLGGGTSEAALLTGNAQVGVNGTGPGSTNQANVNNASTANVNQQSQGTITNNVNVGAQSGNANASNNTKVGDVSTGNANAASSVTNIFNTILNVKHWFGVLVINVFGDWLGDVNNDSAAGTAPGAGSGDAAPVASSGVAALPSVGLLALVNPSGNGGSNVAATANTSNVTSGEGKVLTAAAVSTPKTVVDPAKANNMSLMFVLSALVMLVAGALVSIDKKLRRK